MTDNAYRRTLLIGGIRILANVVTLGAVFLAMYQSFNHPAESLVVFCYWFFGITVTTWVVCGFAMSWIRRRLTDVDEGMVRLPGHRRSCLVRWKVCGRAPLAGRVRMQP